jgi:hypothetical protein
MLKQCLENVGGELLLGCISSKRMESLFLVRSKTFNIENITDMLIIALHD